MIQMSRSNLVLEYSVFENARQALLGEQFAELLEKPLAVWVRPNDRSLPLAFMGRTLKQLLDTPFEELYATPGVGQKKIGRLVDLLHRAAAADACSNRQPLPVQWASEESPQDLRKNLTVGATDSNDLVTEALWDQWRSAVVQFGLERETLGRFARSLQDLPRALWTTMLGSYTDVSLSGIHKLPTHGQKRVSAVLDVFQALHGIVAPTEAPQHLSVSVLPRLVLQLDGWFVAAKHDDIEITRESLVEGLLEPLFEQLHTDGGHELPRAARWELGLGRDSTVPHRLQKATAYQRKKIAAVLAVRWPEGKELLVDLLVRLHGDPQNADRAQLVEAIIHLFYPCASWAPRIVAPAASRSLLAHATGLRREVG